MRVKLRIPLLAALAAVGALVASAPAAQAAFGIEKFIAVNCEVETCAEEKVGPYSFPKVSPEPQAKEEAEAEGFTQAGGRVPFGITHFKVNTIGPIGHQAPDGGP